MEHAIEPTGGLEIGGAADVIAINAWRLNCACNTYVISPEGGMAIGGSAEIAVVRTEGGVVIGGSADVATDNVFGSILNWWLLQETAQPYVDIAWGQNGTGATFAPTRTAGPSCLYSQLFEGEQYISLPDATALQGFSVSCWVNMQSQYTAKVYYSRGVFAFGHAFLNHLWASLETEDGIFEAYSDIQLATDRWYHVACSYSGATLTLYVNGEEQTATATDTITGWPITGKTDSAIGRWNDGGKPECKLLDLRVYASAKGADWWLSEYRNHCDPTFLFVEP